MEERIRLEPNENQGLKSKKNAATNPVSLEIVTKIAGAFKVPSFRETLLLVFCFVIIIGLLQLKLSPRILDLKVGQASKVEIVAPRDIIDYEATKLAQREAVKRALEMARQDLDYYLIDQSVSQIVIFKLNRFFELMDQARKKYRLTHDISEKDLATSKYQSYFHTPPDSALIRKIVLLAPNDYEKLKEYSRKIAGDLELKQRIDSKSLDRVKLLLPQLCADPLMSSEFNQILTELSECAIRPNLIENAAKITELKGRILGEVPKVIHRQGELLITKNQVITENDLKMLKELHLIDDDTKQIKVFLSLALFIMLFTGLGWFYIYQFHPDLFRRERLLYLLLLLSLLIIGAIKGLSLIEDPAVSYLAPVSFTAMMITIFINPQLAILVTTITSLLGGVIMEYNLALTIFYFISGMVGVLSLSHFHRQRDLVRSGLILMCFNALATTVLNLLFWAQFNWLSVVLGTINGISSAILAIGSIPFLEHIFKITSPIRLLELSNPGNPLLRRLQIEAPGTYQHSIMVGNLAEAAAEGIGANALWARVGSYYHDIGKIKRPYFFVENQFGQENPHEKINPTLSKLIIIYHVKEGAEIAREHGLPDQLIDLIEQHHGTDLVRFFYKRATENIQGEKESISLEDFRYEGPKPQTKEAALVMLADSVEAAVRAIPKPTHPKIEALVSKIIRERLDDGQFDECNLTLRELNLIKISFMKVLGGLFHQRIEYPEIILSEMERKKVSGDPGK
ncbi:MAG: HDIG domain-containing protein [Firmicutes bacterium]|nr:HDIG domain-containing protein [Bacillota bacterium]